MIMMESIKQQSFSTQSTQVEETQHCPKPHMTLVEYVQRRHMHHQKYELQQPRLSSPSNFATTLSEDHAEQFVTLTRYIELKCLNAEWLEMDKSVSSSADSQDDSPVHLQLPMVSNPDEYRGRLMSRAEHMRQRFMRQKACSVYTSTSSSTEQFPDDSMTQHMKSPVDRDDKPLLTLAEYAHRRQLRHEQRTTDDAKTISTQRTSTSSSVENLLESVAEQTKESSELPRFGRGDSTVVSNVKSSKKKLSVGFGCGVFGCLQLQYHDQNETSLECR